MLLFQLTSNQRIPNWTGYGMSWSGPSSPNSPNSSNVLVFASISWQILGDKLRWKYPLKKRKEWTILERFTRENGKRLSVAQHLSEQLPVCSWREQNRLQKKTPKRAVSLCLAYLRSISRSLQGKTYNQAKNYTKQCWMHSKKLQNRLTGSNAPEEANCGKAANIWTLNLGFTSSAVDKC